MEFLESRVELSGKTLSMFLPNQFASFVDPESHFSYLGARFHIQLLSKLPLNNKLSFPDVMVFRKTEYFYVSYIYDKSFENNRYTQALAWIERSPEFNKIYSNPAFQVYTKNSP